MSIDSVAPSLSRIQESAVSSSRTIFSIAMTILATCWTPGRTADAVATRDGNTPLHLAVLRGDASAVEKLLAQGADAKATNDAGATALHYAVGSERMVIALLARGAPVIPAA
jgi:hypothetical protein